MPHDFIVEYSDKSWMNAKIMKRWVSDVLAPHAKKLPSGKMGVIIMDNHQSHIDAEVLEKIKKLNYQVELLPANTTGNLQPLDLGVNKPFKDIYSAKWQFWFEDVMNNNMIKTETKSKSKSKTMGYISPSKELCVSWIHKAIKEVSTETIRNAWNIYRNLQITLSISKE